ncbi:MAG: hypothetical protein HQL27_06040 [Candidatus Omnitrophica bacterium]|nr:hypothetical protein [Candidatus Omnitrophota bacterium]
MKRFGILNCTTNKKNRQEILNKLFSSFVDNNLSVLIVKTSPSILEKYLNKKKYLLRDGIIYSFQKREDISPRVNYLLAMPLWHKTIFHIIVGKEGILDEINKIYPKISFKQVDDSLNNFIVGAIDPVDNDFIFYGNEFFNTIVKNCFPGAME